MDMPEFSLQNKAANSRFLNSEEVEVAGPKIRPFSSSSLNSLFAQPNHPSDANNVNPNFVSDNKENSSMLVDVGNENVLTSSDDTVFVSHVDDGDKVNMCLVSRNGDCDVDKSSPPSKADSHSSPDVDKLSMCIITDEQQSIEDIHSSSVIDTEVISMHVDNDNVFSPTDCNSLSAHADDSGKVNMCLASRNGDCDVDQLNTSTDSKDQSTPNVEKLSITLTTDDQQSIKDIHSSSVTDTEVISMHVDNENMLTPSDSKVFASQVLCNRYCDDDKESPPSEADNLSSPDVDKLSMCITTKDQQSIKNIHSSSVTDNEVISMHVANENVFTPTDNSLSAHVVDGEKSSTCLAFHRDNCDVDKLNTSDTKDQSSPNLAKLNTPSGIENKSSANVDKLSPCLTTDVQRSIEDGKILSSSITDPEDNTIPVEKRDVPTSTDCNTLSTCITNGEKVPNKENCDVHKVTIPLDPGCSSAEKLSTCLTTDVQQSIEDDKVHSSPVTGTREDVIKEATLPSTNTKDVSLGQVDLDKDVFSSFYGNASELAQAVDGFIQNNSPSIDDSFWIRSFLNGDDDNVGNIERDIIETSSISVDADYRNLYDDLLQEHAVLVKNYTQLEKDNKTLEKELASSESRLKELLIQKCNNSNEDYLSSWNRREKIEKLIQEKDALERDLEQHKELLKIHAVSSNELLILQKEVAKKSTRTGRLDSENRSLKNEIAELTQQASRVEALKKKNVSIREECNKIKEEKASLLTESEELKSKIQNLNRALWEKDNNLLTVKGENLNLQRQVLELQIPTMAEKKEVEFLSIQNKKLQEENNKIQKEHNSMVEELQSWKTKVGELSKIISEKVFDAANIQALKDIPSSVCTSCQQQKDVLNKQYEKLQFQLDQIQKAQVPFLKEKDFLSIKLEELNKLMCDKGMDLVELKKKNELLNTYVVDLKSTILDMKKNGPDHQDSIPIKCTEVQVDDHEEYLPPSPLELVIHEDEVPSSTSDTIVPIISPSPSSKVEDDLARRLEETRAFKKEMKILRSLIQQPLSPIPEIHKVSHKRTMPSVGDIPELSSVEDCLEKPSKKRRVYSEQQQSNVDLPIPQLQKNSLSNSVHSPYDSKLLTKLQNAKVPNVHAILSGGHTDASSLVANTKLTDSFVCGTSHNSKPVMKLQSPKVTGGRSNINMVASTTFGDSSSCNTSHDIKSLTRLQNAKVNNVQVTPASGHIHASPVPNAKFVESSAGGTSSRNKPVTRLQNTKVTNVQATFSGGHINTSTKSVDSSVCGTSRNFTKLKNHKLHLNSSSSSNQNFVAQQNGPNKNSAFSQLAKTKKNWKSKGKSRQPAEIDKIPAKTEFIDVLRQLESLRYKKILQPKICFNIHRALIDPAIVDCSEKAVTQIIQYLIGSNRNPLMSYVEESSPHVLTPISEKCLVEAIEKTLVKKKVILEDFMSVLLSHLRQRAIEDKSITIYGTAALCRVMALFRKAVNIDLLKSLCINLLLHRMEIAHFIIASMIGVNTHFIQPDESRSNYIFKAWNYLLMSRPPGITDTQWQQCQAVFMLRKFTSSPDYPSLIVGQIGQLMSEAETNHTTITDCEGLLKVFAVKEGWKWCKEFLLKRVIFTGITAWNNHHKNFNGLAAFLRLISFIDQYSPENDNTCPGFVDTHLSKITSDSIDQSVIIERMVRKCRNNLQLRHGKMEVS